MPAQFSTLFLEHMLELANIAQAYADSAKGNNQTNWHNAGVNTTLWDGDVLNISGMNYAFDRADLQQAHKEILATLGSIGDSRAVKLQSDYFAGMERAFRSRHATSIRCKMHAAGRKDAHADGGGIYYTLIKYIQDLIAAGNNGGDNGVS